MSEAETESKALSPAVAGAPKLAGRLDDWLAMAGEVGLSEALMRAGRVREVTLTVEGGEVRELRRHTVRHLEAEVAVGERALALSTLELHGAGVRTRLQEARARLESGAPECFAASSARWRAAPVGPFDDLKLLDAGLVEPELDVLRGYAVALARPVDGRVTLTARSIATAIGRSDGARVAVHHTTVTVALHRAGRSVARTSRFLVDLPRPSEWLAEEQLLDATLKAERTELSGTPRKMVVVPEAGVPLLKALVAQPLKTVRLSDRLSVLADPWVARGLGSTPFDHHGQASRPTPLIEGGQQRRRWPGPSDAVGNLRVSLGGRSLARLVGETDHGVLVRGWKSVAVHPQTGRMELHGYGAVVSNGEPSRAVPHLVVRGTLPELFRGLQTVGSDPWTYHEVRAPTLVFADVAVQSA